MLNNRLSDLRKEHDLTQEELAKKLNITRSSLSLYELGKRDPDTNTLKMFAEFFNVSVDYLLGLTNSKEAPKIFIGKKLSLLRGKKTYNEYSEYLSKKGTVTISPLLLEQYEKGKQPPATLVEHIANVEGIKSEYFYNKHADKIEYNDNQINKPKHDPLYFMSEEVKEWILNENNYPYIEFMVTFFKTSSINDLISKVSERKKES